jgi:hypothetical protein
MDVRPFVPIAVAWVALLATSRFRGLRAAALLLVASLIYVSLGALPEPPRNVARILLGSAVVAVAIFKQDDLDPLKREDRAYLNAIQRGLNEALGVRRRYRKLDPEARRVMVDRIRQGIETISGIDPPAAEWRSLQQQTIDHLRLWLDVYADRVPANDRSEARIERDWAQLQRQWTHAIQQKRRFWSW